MPLLEEANEFDPTEDHQAFTAEQTEKDQARRGEVVERFRTARRHAVGNLHLVAARVADDVDDDVAGTERAAMFYEHVTASLIRSNAAGEFSSQAGATQAQVIELESVRGELNDAQRRLSEQQSVEDQLRASAYQASDLQNEIFDLRQKLLDKDREMESAQDRLDVSNASNAELLTELNELRPFKAEAEQLRQQLADEKQAHGVTMDELGQLRQQQTLAPPAPPGAEPLTRAVDPAPPAQSLDEVLQEFSSPATATSGDPEAHEQRTTIDTPALSHKEELGRRRGLRDKLHQVREHIPGSGNPTNTPKEGEK